MENLDKKYYRIAEVAAIVGVPQSTLRFWESRSRGVIKPRRNAGGTRFYTPADVEAVRMVHYLVKERGLKIDAAIAELLRNREGVSRRFDAIDRLRTRAAAAGTRLTALTGRAELFHVQQLFRYILRKTRSVNTTLCRST